MDTLYVANATARNHHLHYRIPEVEKLFDQTIPAGQQWQIPEAHRNEDAISAIIAELVRYGATKREDVDRNPKFSGLIYGFAPISVDAIRQGFEDVEQAAIDRALEERTRGVIAADEQVARLAQEAGTGVGAVELTVTEEPTQGGDNSDLQKNVIQVQREGQPKSERSKAVAARAAAKK